MNSLNSLNSLHVYTTDHVQSVQNTCTILCNTKEITNIHRTGCPSHHPCLTTTLSTALFDRSCRPYATVWLPLWPPPTTTHHLLHIILHNIPSTPICGLQLDSRWLVVCGSVCITGRRMRALSHYRTHRIQHEW